MSEAKIILTDQQAKNIATDVINNLPLPEEHKEFFIKGLGKISPEQLQQVAQDFASAAKSVQRAVHALRKAGGLRHTP